MKKILSTILAVLVMLMSLVLPASAADGNLGTSVSLSNDKTSFTVNLVLNDNPGIISMIAAVSYDSKVVKLTSAKNGTVFEEFYEEGPDFSANPYKVIWMEATAPEDIKTNGVLVTYTFEVLKNAPNGQSEIKFDITDAINVDMADVKFNGCSVKIDVKDGNVSSTQSQTFDSATNDTTIGSGVDTSDKNDQSTDAQNPESDTTVSGEETEPQEDAEINVGAEKDEKVEKDNNGKGNPNSNQTLIIILTIAGILIIGGGITFIAIYKRKKAADKKQ